MAKITWTSVGSASRAARGLVSLFRTQLTVMADAAKKDRGTIVAVRTVLRDVLAYLGVVVPATGGTVTLKDVNGTSYGTTGTYEFDVNGVLTGIRLTSSARVIRNGVEFPSPQATGTWTDGYTPTISNGAVTALVGS